MRLLVDDKMLEVRCMRRENPRDVKEEKVCFATLVSTPLLQRSEASIEIVSKKHRYIRVSIIFVYCC